MCSQNPAKEKRVHRSFKLVDGTSHRGAEGGEAVEGEKEWKSVVTVQRGEGYDKKKRVFGNDEKILVSTGRKEKVHTGVKRCAPKGER